MATLALSRVIPEGLRCARLILVNGDSVGISEETAEELLEATRHFQEGTNYKDAEGRIYRLHILKKVAVEMVEEDFSTFTYEKVAKMERLYE